MILVTGATGHIGRELVPQLVKTGQPARVLVRDERKVAHLDPCVERAVGDLNNPETLISAMQGVERVFLVTFETQQDVNVLKAAKQIGVRHVVKLSTLEATQHVIQVGKWHYEREELIRTSGLEWTFLRPGMFMSNSIDWWADSIKQQGAVYFPGGQGKVAPVDPWDVAAVAVAAGVGEVDSPRPPITLSKLIQEKRTWTTCFNFGSTQSTWGFCSCASALASGYWLTVPPMTKINNHRKDLPVWLSQLPPIPTATPWA